MRFIKNIIKRQIEKWGLTFFHPYQYSTLKSYPAEVLAELEKCAGEERIDSVIFSKDRAIQLHAFIESFYQKVEGAARLYVLYKATEKHIESYEELKRIWSHNDVVFVEEKNFREQIIEICSNATAKTLGFYVDDMVFTQEVSYSQILKYPTSRYVVCLWRGLDFTYSQVIEKELKMPVFNKLADGFNEFAWNETGEFGDWTYPLGVSSYFYSRAEITAMFKLTHFKAPNTLEIEMQNFLPFFEDRKGLCYNGVACCCIPINLVQEECVNPTTDHVSVEELLEKWEQGYKVDISKFEGVGVKGVFMNYDYIKR